MAELLYTAIGGDPSRLTAARENYRTNCATVLLALIAHAHPIGIAGYELNHTTITLRHIATAAQHRRTGTARHLLTEIRSRHPNSDLTAETDADSLPFYLAIGFTATSLGEKYPGTERFRVHLPGLQPNDSPPPPSREP
ncbi:GNAT family N-acetyltransferase [Nocardia macrotermitis]|uniref:GNAT family N-acetyltransferase n=1 Tax=Nocardia macrotermitis TaxID=2585198 RepID=UPI00188644B3|nr:GNAT family N-acetyltransferase [Nocardia macrotermitis]